MSVSWGAAAGNGGILEFHWNGSIAYAVGAGICKYFMLFSICWRFAVPIMPLQSVFEDMRAGVAFPAWLSDRSWGAVHDSLASPLPSQGGPSFWKLRCSWQLEGLFMFLYLWVSAYQKRWQMRISQVMISSNWTLHQWCILPHLPCSEALLRGVFVAHFASGMLCGATGTDRIPFPKWFVPSDKPEKITQYPRLGFIWTTQESSMR